MATAFGSSDIGLIVALTAVRRGFAYHPRMLVELLRLIGWLLVVIIVVSLIALLLTQGRL